MAGIFARFRERLTAENRPIRLAIKEGYWRQPAYRDTITGDLICRAVLDQGVTTAEEFAHVVNKSTA